MKNPDPHPRNVPPVLKFAISTVALVMFAESGAAEMRKGSVAARTAVTNVRFIAQKYTGKKATSECMKWSFFTEILNNLSDYSNINSDS